ncbi:MAG: hypothetical protein IT405_03810 [Candidatus Yanofskybacteria bacterium]|nr:hypothetical protein [Candidatus Yanofskybacteria bacterium]
MFGLDHDELRVVRRLNTPVRVQNYLETLRYSFDAGNDALRSPRRVLREGSAHCIEGALLAATAFWVQGARPLLLDLRSTPDDLDHVVAPFRAHGCWGAVSKTNHAVLRYREPIYRTIRELALSYVHEYFLDDGRKTMRDYSLPFDLRRYGSAWITSNDDLWHIAEDLDDSPHRLILSAAQRRGLRRADPVEIRAGKLTVWRRR